MNRVECELAVSHHRIERFVRPCDTMPEPECPGPRQIFVTDRDKRGARDRAQCLGVPLGDIPRSKKPNAKQLDGFVRSQNS